MYQAILMLGVLQFLIRIIVQTTTPPSKGYSIQIQKKPIKIIYEIKCIPLNYEKFLVTPTKTMIYNTQEWNNFSLFLELYWKICFCTLFAKNLSLTKEIVLLELLPNFSSKP